MSTYWISVNGEPGQYVEAESIAEAVALATFMNGSDIGTLTIEDHTKEETCP